MTDSKAAQENGGVAEEGADQTDKLTDWLNKGNSIGTGPYRLTQWDIANEIIIEKNADYWGDAQVDRIIFRNVADSSTQLQLLETGEADMAFLLTRTRCSRCSTIRAADSSRARRWPTNILPCTPQRRSVARSPRRKRGRRSRTPSTMTASSMVFSVGTLSGPRRSFPSACSGADEVADQALSDRHRQSQRALGRQRQRSNGAQADIWRRSVLPGGPQP